MMGKRVEAIRTPVEFSALARALADVWERREGNRPSWDSVALLLAQSALETGRWKHAYRFNLGNAKAGAKWEGNYCFYPADEIVKPNEASKAYERRLPRTDGKAGHDVLCAPLESGLVRVSLWPDHPWCRFRAFDSLEEGVVDYLELLRTRFAAAWPALERADPEAFIGALKRTGYFTASLEHYLPPVVLLFEEFRKKLHAGTGTGAGAQLPTPVGERPLVLRGARGAFVREIQTLLLAAGYEDLELTGSFDEATRRAVVLFQLQHVDPQGLPLEPDGKVGPKTWWALLNDAGDAQRNFLAPPVAAGLTPARTKLLELLVAEHAKPVFEEPNGSNGSPDIDRYWGNTGLRRLPWCCAFVSWALQESLGRLPIGGKHHVGVQVMWLAAKKAGLETREPKPGDVFIQIKTAGTGHTGFVVSVSEDGETVYTCEGNCGNRLKLGQRPRASIDHFVDCIADGQSKDFPRGSNLKFEDVSALGTG